MIPTEPSSTPTIAATGTLFVQLDDSAESAWSHYGDNWFTLGSGYAGTLTALTLKGKVNAPDYFPTLVYLQEFKDKDYHTLIQQFPLGSAPFTTSTATTTLSGFSVLLKPYFFYRLLTVQNFQDNSALLEGVTSTPSGTMMWNQFIYGSGRVEFTGPFFPYMVMEGIFATSTLTPPPLTSPSHIVENFDQLGMQISVSWATSTDPDWPANPLHYQMDWSTSTALTDDGWSDPAPIPVTPGSTYLIGVRAADAFGAISAPATTTWHVPDGFVPYLLSPSLSYAYQYFAVTATSTLSSIQLFTKNFQTGARNWGMPLCFLQIFDEYASSSLEPTPPDGPVGVSGSDCGYSPVFSFDRWPLVLHPDHRYHWILTATTGNPSTGAAVHLYGTPTDTAGGPFSDPSLANAKFTMIAADGSVIFSN